MIPIVVYITHMGSENYWEAVAGNVRAEMARRKRTATDLVNVLHMSRNSVYRRMNGEVPFDLAELQLVAEWLGVSLVALSAVDSMPGQRVAA